MSSSSSLSQANILYFCHQSSRTNGMKTRQRRPSFPFMLEAAFSAHGSGRVSTTNSTILCSSGTKERIQKLFHKVELSISPYDTAWVAMVPAPDSIRDPCFPQCLNWLLDNQLPDGSWGPLNHHPQFLKDALSSTLACILALQKWQVGERQINKGVDFIKSNFSAAIDENQYPPIGFDIIFPGMLQFARELTLNLRLEPKAVGALLHKRNSELRRCYASNSKKSRAYLAYVSEGIGNLQDWEMVMEYQRKNGSIFNSPSSTAAALTFHRNSGCLDYLHSVLEKYGDAVPAVFPMNIYARLSMVDHLERLGIHRFFTKEIQELLDEIYRCWLQEEEEIFMDASTCALAFRMLRINGYDVSPDPLTQFLEEKSLSTSFGRNLKDVYDALELYRASEIVICSDESTLVQHNLCSKCILEQALSDDSFQSNSLLKLFNQEVEDVLKFPFHASLERIAHRRSIMQYNVNNTRFLKTSYWSSNISNKDFLMLAIEDFNSCQSIHREEFKLIAKWVSDNKLDELKFARQKFAYGCFSAAATLFAPELSDARMSWAKNCVLTTVVDDFFDIGGTMEELRNLVQLVEKWDVNISNDCCSEQVKILFSALKVTICEIGEKALIWQGRRVTDHIVEIWLNLLYAMLREAEWAQKKTTPTMEEYMDISHVSFALGPIVLPTLYFVGPKLSEEVAKHPEVQNLFKLMSTCGRLLNDIQSFERESKDGKLNAVNLHMIAADISQEAAIEKIKCLVDVQRQELLRLVLQRKNSIIPRSCKDLFWNMSKVLHQFYIKDDGFSSEEMIKTVKAIIHEPVALEGA